MLLHIDPIFFAGYYPRDSKLKFSLLTNQTKRYDPGYQQLRNRLARLLYRMPGQTPEDILRKERLLYDIILLLFEYGSPEIVEAGFGGSNLKNFSAIDQMSRYIEQHYQEKLSLERLAEKHNYHPAYISQLFSRELGITYHTYLTRIRLREATRELVQSNRTIADIALSHGFPDVKSFNTAFRKAFNKTPHAYRSQVIADHLAVDSIFQMRYVSQGDSLVQEKLKQYTADPVSKEFTREIL